MKKKEKQERVVLEMSREQAMIVERVCELFARLEIGQSGDGVPKCEIKEE